VVLIRIPQGAHLLVVAAQALLEEALQHLLRLALMEVTVHHLLSLVHW
jgi:hypothetical protein